MKSHRLACALVGVSVVMAIAAGCAAGPGTSHTSSAAADYSVAGDIPDDTVYVAVPSPSGAFSIKVPQGWAQTTSADGTTVYTDKLNSISIQQIAASTPPTTASVTSSLVPQLQSRVSQFASKDVSTVSLPGGDAVRVRYSFDAPPNSVTNKTIADAAEAYVFWKQGQEVLLTLAGPVNADNVDPWKTVSESFAWTK